jgi:hypothetical protein
VKHATCWLICTTLIAGPVHAAPEATPPPETPTASASASASASPTAAELSGQAIERFQAKDYDAAARLFEQAYGIDKNPNYLFNIGRVYEEKGDIRLAVDFYQRFVKEPGVDIGSRELAVQRLSVLRAILRETEPAATGPTGPAAGDAGAAQPTAKPIADDPDPKKSMRLGGYAMLGVGGIALIVGGVFGGLALGKNSDLEEPAHDRRAPLAGPVRHDLRARLRRHPVHRRGSGRHRPRPRARRPQADQGGARAPSPPTSAAATPA